jgi:hypothetical protein
MSVYVDPDWVHQNKATVTVSEEPRTARVIYRGDDGRRFRINVVQKANPIGFHARLPGDKRK